MVEAGFIAHYLSGRGASYGVFVCESEAAKHYTLTSRHFYTGSIPVWATMKKTEIEKELNARLNQIPHHLDRRKMRGVIQRIRRDDKRLLFKEIFELPMIADEFGYTFIKVEDIGNLKQKHNVS